MGLLANFEPMNAPKAMTFIEAVKFSYKNYGNFNGRASRSEFWYWMLYFFVAAYGLSTVWYDIYVIWAFASVTFPFLVLAGDDLSPGTCLIGYRNVPRF